MVGKKVRIIDSIDTEVDGKLSEELIGDIYIVKKIDEKGIWVNVHGQNTLLLYGEFEIIDDESITIPKHYLKALPYVEKAMDELYCADDNLKTIEIYKDLRKIKDKLQGK
jgi:hypothetical protein